MRGVRQSADLFFRGPVWAVAGAVGFVTTVAAILSDHAWMWLFFTALALVIASFVSFHRERRAVADPHHLAEIVAGFALVGDQLANENAPPVQAVAKWQARAREFLFDVYGHAAIALYVNEEGAAALPAQVDFFRSLLDTSTGPNLPLRSGFTLGSWWFASQLDPKTWVPSQYPDPPSKSAAP